MINFALIGAGRIGKMHAEIINANLDATLKFVYDVNSQLANEVADISNAEVILQNPLDPLELALSKLV